MPDKTTRGAGRTAAVTEGTDAVEVKLPYEICAEEWRLPNGHDLLELSIKSTREQAAAGAAFEGFLRELGFEVDGGQETKTRAALEYLAHGA